MPRTHPSDPRHPNHPDNPRNKATMPGGSRRRSQEGTLVFDGFGQTVLLYRYGFSLDVRLNHAKLSTTLFCLHKNNRQLKTLPHCLLFLSTKTQVLLHLHRSNVVVVVVVAKAHLVIVVNRLRAKSNRIVLIQKIALVVIRQQKVAKGVKSSNKKNKHLTHPLSR